MLRTALFVSLVCAAAAFSSGSPTCDKTIPAASTMPWAGRASSVQYQLVSATGTYSPGLSSTLSLEALAGSTPLLELRGFEIHAEQNGSPVGKKTAQHRHKGTLP